MTPTVLVTGANGYTGKYMCEYLAQQGVATRGMYWPPDGEPDYAHENLELVPGDLRDRETLKPALDGIEVVYNIAALYRTMTVSEQMYFDVNAAGVGNLVELAAEAGVRRFVQCSTMGVHGTVADPPGTEEAPIQPDDYYQLTKLKGEEIARELGQQLNLPMAIVRPAAIYGPRETRFRKLAQLISRGRFVMFGDGEVLYHFVHVRDLCDGFILCAELDQAVGETYLIADDHAVTLNTVVRVLAEATGKKPPRLHVPFAVLQTASIACEFACKPFGISPPLHRRRAAWFRSTRSFDIGKARRELGYEPKVKTEQGLTEMVQSFAEAGWL